MCWSIFNLGVQYDGQILYCVSDGTNPLEIFIGHKERPTTILHCTAGAYSKISPLRSRDVLISRKWLKMLHSSSYSQILENPARSFHWNSLQKQFHLEKTIHFSKLEEEISKYCFWVCFTPFWDLVTHFLVSFCKTCKIYIR